MNTDTITKIEKEFIPGLSLHYHEVLDLPEQVLYRKLLLQKAMILGNTHHTKVKLVFSSDQGIFQVETTVWAATDDFVLLKGGVYLPVGSIMDVIIP
ncbi:MAG: hypothetical protein ACHQFW_05050 [Chitinophagales bacterium]